MGTAEQSSTSRSPVTEPAQPGGCRAALPAPSSGAAAAPGLTPGWGFGCSRSSPTERDCLAPGKPRAKESGSGGPGTCRDVTGARSLRSPAGTPRAPGDRAPEPRQRQAVTGPAGSSGSAAALPDSSSSPRPSGVKTPLNKPSAVKTRSPAGSHYREVTTGSELSPHPRRRARRPPLPSGSPREILRTRARLRRVPQPHSEPRPRLQPLRPSGTGRPPGRR